MHRLLFFCLCCLPMIAEAQARIILQNDPWMVMQNNVYLVIENSSTNAITTSGTGGMIVSEAEGNYVQWTIGAGTGNYIIPFANAAGVKIPLTMSITTAALGNGSIGFSTYNCATWDNDLYKPSGVTNMTNMGVTDASQFVIDRFWITKASGFTTLPAGNLTFTYIDAEHTATGNVIAESELRAERYEPVSDSWELYAPGGVVNTIANTVSNVAFTSVNFMKDWSLIDQTAHLLPLQVVDVDLECAGDNSMIVHWQTASEINTDYFTISIAQDGVHYTEYAKIPAAGNSVADIDYQLSLINNSTAYVQLSCTDIDGYTYIVSVLPVPCAFITSTLLAWDAGYQQLGIATGDMQPGRYPLQIYALSGQLVYDTVIDITDAQQQVILDGVSWSGGVYMVVLVGQGGERITRKVCLKD